MTSDRNDLDDRGSSEPRKRGTGQANKPQWASGLRQLYDSVVEEDLPDQFKDLLSRLDEKD